MYRSPSSCVLLDEAQLFADFLAIKDGDNEYYQSHNRSEAIKREAENMRTIGYYTPLIADMALSSVLERPVYSLYPDWLQSSSTVSSADTATGVCTQRGVLCAVVT